MTPQVFTQRAFAWMGILFIGGLCMGGAFPGPQDPNQLMRQAIELQQKGEFQYAIRIYETLIAAYPGIADLHSNLGAACASAGDLGRAIENYQRALSLGNGSNPAEIRFNLALAFYKSARFDEAGEELEQVLSGNPRHTRAALLLGDIHLRRGDWREVIRILQPFESELGNDRAYIYQMGTALIREGRSYEGEVLIDRILRNGDSAEARFLLGTAYLMVLDYEGAIEQFNKALALNPDLPTLNAVYGRTLRESGQLDESVKYFKRELEIDPNHFDSLLFTGIFLYKQEQKYDEALEYFNRALRVRPGNIDVLFQIGLVYVLTDRVDQALGIIESVVNQAPEFLEGHVTLTRLYYRLRRRDDAERHRRIAEELRAKQDAENVKSQQEAEALQKRLAEKKAGIKDPGE